MVFRRDARFRTGVLVGVAVVALAVAGCGSSSSSSSSGAASSSPSSSGSSGSAKKVAISTAKGSAGTYLVGPSGRALYLWVADSNGQSSCSAACAKVWPPVTATATPTAAGSVKAADLGTITRSDGTKQVTYMGHPLYYYAADAGPGKVKGQGSNSFGAKWWLVAPSGTAITRGAVTSASASGSSSGSAS